MSCSAKKYRKIKGTKQSEYPGISRKDAPYYLKKTALLARLSALAAGERSAFTETALLYIWLPGEKHLILFTATYRASDRKSVPTERAASSAKELFWRIGDLPNKQFCRAKCRVCATLHRLPFAYSSYFPLCPYYNLNKTLWSTLGDFFKKKSHFSVTFL